MVKRFVDKNYPYYSYAYKTKIWIKCPKCQALAFVWEEKTGENYLANCACTHCAFRGQNLFTEHFTHRTNQYRSFSYYNMKDDLQNYFGEVRVTIKEKCSCKEGKFLLDKFYADKTKIPTPITLNCSFCGESKDFFAKDDNVKVQRNAQIDSDPFLNYPLYLREETDLGKIFAYHPEQLATLKAYIMADLRENTHYHKSYFSRMPTWIKSAKNRDLVLKAIGKLEQKVFAHSNENVK